MHTENYKKHLENILSNKRFSHSLSVSSEAVKLANRWGANPKKAEISGLLHDITKDKLYEEHLELCTKYNIIVSDVERLEPKLLHAITGASVIIYEFSIKDQEIINAIRYHTTARASMTLLEKIIYLADFIEPLRETNENLQKLKSLAYEDLDQAMLLALDLSIQEIVNKKSMIHINTIHARNDIILQNIYQ